jgi:hypothetical protein
MIKAPKKSVAEPGKGRRHTTETEALVCKYYASGFSQQKIVAAMKSEHGISMTRQTVMAIVRRASPYATAINKTTAKLLGDGETLELDYFIALLYERMQDGWEHLPIRDRYSASMYRLHANLIAQLIAKLGGDREDKLGNDDARKAVDDLINKLRAAPAELSTQTDLN